MNYVLYKALINKEEEKQKRKRKKENKGAFEAVFIDP
jgi:hypothetical protein